MKRQNVFKNKNYSLLFAGIFASNIASVFYSFAVSFYILYITGNNAFIQGVYLAMSGVVLLMGTIIGGVLADRLDKAKLVYMMDYLKGFVILATGLTFTFFTDLTLQLILLFVAGVVSSLINAVFMPASNALIRFIVADEELQQANSYLSSLHSFQNIIGIILAGLLYTMLDIHIIFILVGSLYIVSGFSEMFIKYNHEKTDHMITVKSVLFDFKDGFHYLKTKKAIVAIIMAALFLNFFTNPIFSNGMTYFINTELANGFLFDNIIDKEMWLSIFNVSLSIGALITGIIVGSQKPKEKYGSQMKIWILVMASTFIMMALAFYFFVETSNNVNMYLIIQTLVMFLMGIAMIKVNIPISTTMHKVVDRDKIAKVSSLTSVGAMGLTPIASLLAGALITGLGLSFLYFFCAIGFTAAALVFFRNKAVNEI